APPKRQGPRDRSEWPRRDPTAGDGRSAGRAAVRALRRRPRPPQRAQPFVRLHPRARARRARRRRRPLHRAAETSRAPNRDGRGLMAADFYDVVIIGSDLAASVAGAVLAHRGFRVLVAGVNVEEKYSIGPYVLPRAPLAFVGLESPAIKRLLGELNLVQLLRRRLEPNRPAYQLLLPDHPIDVGDDRAREIQREWPDMRPAVEGAHARLAEVSSALEGILAQDLILPPDGFWDRRDVNRVGARLPDGNEDLQKP